MDRRIITMVVILFAAGSFSCLAPDLQGTQQQKVDITKLPDRVPLIGKDFSNWRQPVRKWQTAGDVTVDPDNKKRLAIEPGTGIIGANGGSPNLISRAEFGDIRAHIEFMVPQRSNSGVYFMGRYEIQVFDSWQVETPAFSDCGGIYQRWDNSRTPKGFEGKPPKVNASLPPGTWQYYDVIFRAPRFDSSGKKTANARFVKVVHNGILIHENREVTGPTRASTYKDEKPLGPLMLQGDHGPVAYRNIWIAPIEDGQVLINPFFALDTGTKDASHRTAKAQVQMLKELGYSGIGYTGLRNIEQMLPELKAANLKLYAVYLGANLDADKEKYDPNLKDAIAKLKGTNAVLWLPIYSKTYKPSSQENDPLAVEIVREIADMAARSNLKVALYPHANIWLERTSDAIRLIEKIDRPNVGLTFNLCHWLKVEGPGDLKKALEPAIDRLFLVTINGADGSETKKAGWNRLIQRLGEGSYDVYPLLKTLKELGYTGPIGLQAYGIKGDANENLSKSMLAWKKLSTKLAAENSPGQLQKPQP